MVFLYCVFHLDQALRKCILKMKSPGMNPEEFSRFKGHLLREIHELVCGVKGTKPIPEHEFDLRAQKVSHLLWKRGMSTEATRWDHYVANKSRWAPYARDQAFFEAFGRSQEKLPMLLHSDNIMESFFRVLKYIELDGESVTMSGLLYSWVGMQSRIVANILESNIDLGNLLRNQATPRPTSDFVADEDESDSEDDDEHGMKEDKIKQIYTTLEARERVRKRNKHVFGGIARYETLFKTPETRLTNCSNMMRN